MMKRILIAVIILLFLVSCSPFNQKTMIKSPSSSSVLNKGKSPWWKTAVFYEIFVRSYYDSNGDGIGDFKGIQQKLDYLQSLGVNAIWLMPVYPSPSYHGYDVENYFAVNPQYGTMDDFKSLLAEAHKRGMHVILDLELNHTSDQNPWFFDSNNNVQSPYRDWYIWSNNDPKYTGPTGRIAWWQGKTGYYYGIFGQNMPDLNYREQAVTDEMNKVVSFWLKDVGVDGFRLDAINYLIEEGQNQQNTPSTHAWLKNFYTTYKSDNPQAFVIGEVYGADATLAKTYIADQMDMVFNFELANAILNSVKGEASSAVNSALTFAQQQIPTWDFGTFLTNHDQNRTMSTLSGNIGQAKSAAFLLLTSPGTPFIYYGEEIGMQGEKPDEDIRLPMQWSADGYGGFSTAVPWRQPNADYLKVNVNAEKADQNSLLNYYSKLISIRSQNPTLALGNLVLLQTGNPGVFAALRHDEKGTMLVIANLTDGTIDDLYVNGNDVGIPNGKYACKELLFSETCSKMTVKGGGIQNYQPFSSLAPNTGYILAMDRRLF